MEQNVESKPVAPEAAKPAETDKKARGRNKSKFKLIALIVAAVLVVGGGVLALILILKAANGDKTIYDTDAFFIRENTSSNAKYALFKNDGSKLTDFSFAYAGRFIDGYAIVRNDDYKYGIISHDGNMTVEFDTYKYIDAIASSGLYKVENPEYRAIITGNGSEVAKDYVDYENSYETPFVAIHTEDNHYKLVNAQGKEVLSFDSEEKPKFSTHSATTASAIYYNGHLAVLNNKKLSVEHTQDTGEQYELQNVSPKLEAFLFRADNKYASYSKGKFVEYGEQCKSMSLMYSSGFEGIYYYSCYKDDGTFLVRNGEITDIKLNDYSTRYTVIDENHYAKYVSSESKVYFYVDGKEVGSTDCGYSPSASGNKGYSIRDYKNRRIALYDIEGKQLYEITDTTSGEIYGLDRNENILVRDAREESESRYYLVNKKGEVISGKYSSISVHGEYYTAYHSAAKTADLLDKEGKTIVSGEYTSFDFYNDETLIFAKKDSTHLDLVDIKGKSVKASFEGSITVNKNGYFQVSGEKENIFYTFEAKDFYHQEKKN